MTFTQRFQTINEVRAFSLQHETLPSQEFLHAYSSFACRLGGTFLICGSVGFDQAEAESDLDITFVRRDLPSPTSTSTSCPSKTASVGITSVRGD